MTNKPGEIMNNEIINHYDNAKPGKAEAELQARAFDYIIDVDRRVAHAAKLQALHGLSDSEAGIMLESAANGISVNNLIRGNGYTGRLKRCCCGLRG